MLYAIYQEFMWTCSEMHQPTEVARILFRFTSSPAAESAVTKGGHACTRGMHWFPPCSRTTASNFKGHRCGQQGSTLVRCPSRNPATKDPELRRQHHVPLYIGITITPSACLNVREQSKSSLGRPSRGSTGTLDTRSRCKPRLSSSSGLP